MAVRIGVDSGGTFTDIVVVNDRELLLCDKVASTPAYPGSAVLNGILQAIQRLKIEPSDIFQIIHGTTVATNALLERKGARTALITTRGFRDVLAIQRQNRPELYNLRSRKPQPLVPRELRFEIHERPQNEHPESEYDPYENWSYYRSFGCGNLSPVTQ